MIKVENITEPVVQQQKLLIKFLNNYSTPSFGTLSKRDVDISVFMLMQDLGLMAMHPQIYDVVSFLHVTSSKARNLIYEASLRRSTQETLNTELLELLRYPIFFVTSNDIIAIEVDNPLLIDHLKQKLRELKFITDGSFNRGIVKMSLNAYATLFDVCLSDIDRERLFPQMGTIQYEEDLDISPDDNASIRSKKVLMWILEKITKVAASEISEEWMPQILDKIKEIPSMETIQNFIKWLKENNLIL